jgi:hypothetical protein
MRPFLSNSLRGALLRRAPQPPQSGRRRLVAILAAAFAGLGALELLVVMHPHGPGISPDSVNYLSAADGLASSGTVMGFVAGDHLAVFPPLYAMLLVPGDVFGAPLGGAQVVQALAFGLLVAIGMVGTERVAPGPLYPGVLGTALLMSVPLIGVASFVWSDIVFALLAALFLVAVTQIGSRPHAVVISALIADCATLTRYIGITTIPLGLFVIMLWSRRRRRDLVLFLAVSLLVPAVWALRNLVVSSTIVGNRHSAADGLETAVHDTARTLGGWLDPGHPAAGLTATGAIALVAIVTFRRSSPRRLELVAFAFVALYIVWLDLSAATVALDPIDTRFLTPIYVPLAWIVAGTVRRATYNRHVFAGLAAVAAIVVWGAFQASRIPALFDDVESASLQTFPRWSFADERRIRKYSSHVYSNAPDTVYLRSGDRVSFSPRRIAYRSNSPLHELGSLRSTLSSGQAAVLIWFRRVERPAIYSPSELASYFTVRVLETNAATIYRLSCPCNAAAAGDR